MVVRRWAVLAASMIAVSAHAQSPPLRDSFKPVRAAEDCPGDRSPILILGTYHMSNPGLDAINIEADDVFSKRRQAEIQTLVNNLARFRPTKVMLEAAYKSPVQQERYEQYLAGKYQLSRNEIDQIGFRLASQAGLKKVTSVDYPLWMSGQSADELELKPAPKSVASKSAPTPKQPEVLEAEGRLRQSTVSEYLFFMNQREQWFGNNHLRYYMDNFEPDPTSPALYARTDSLTNWYKRNFRMFSNIVRTTDRPKDRVIMIVGAGHLAILRGLTQDMSGFCLVEPSAYLGG